MEGIVPFRGGLARNSAYAQGLLALARFGGEYIRRTAWDRLSGQVGRIFRRPRGTRTVSEYRRHIKKRRGLQNRDIPVYSSNKPFRRKGIRGIRIPLRRGIIGPISQISRVYRRRRYGRRFSKKKRF